MDRRGFFKLLGIVGSIPVLNKFAEGSPKRLSMDSLKKEAKINVAYHADFGEVRRFTTMLRNIRNHLSVYDNDPTEDLLSSHTLFKVGSILQKREITER
ncbi:hypothetical protein [Thermocrinis sp.]